LVTQTPPLSAAAYLHSERYAELKSEYVNGTIVAMAGASKEHNTLTFNLAVEVGLQLKGKSYQGFSSDLRVRVPAFNRYYYPDLVVVSGPPEFEDTQFDTLLNPILIAEVLSESTEAKDRGEKLIAYQSLPSLMTYVLISQVQPCVEVYQRQSNGWLYQVTQGLENRVLLAAIDCELNLTEIYARIIFQEEPKV
jgi:Uma2 family endonuclease